MAEPADTTTGEAANPPAEVNAPAPVSSQPPPSTEQASHEASVPPPESTQVPTPSTEPQPAPSEPSANSDPAEPSAGSAPPEPVEPTAPPVPSAPSAPLVPPATDIITNHQEVGSNSAQDAKESVPAPSVTTASVMASLPAMDTSLPPIDSSHLDDNELPSFDAALRAVASSGTDDLSLPAIDTTLPSLDASLPAIGTDIPTMDHPFDDSHFGHHDSHDGSEHTINTGHETTRQGSINGSTHYQTPSNDNYQTPSNGNYQYAQNSQHDGQQSSQASPQHQYQSQPQQSYQQQTSDMYHNTGGGFASVNAGSNNNGPGQHGQVPQAPIGSPMPSNMPPMASMGQYMTGYPSSSPNSNSQMGYGDPSKMLSGGRHKKEVKRRTKTGCLTCRKRRIKVRWFLAWEILHVALRGAQGLACCRGPRHRLSLILSPA